VVRLWFPAGRSAGRRRRRPCDSSRHASCLAYGSLRCGPSAASGSVGTRSIARPQTQRYRAVREVNENPDFAIWSIAVIDDLRARAEHDTDTPGQAGCDAGPRSRRRSAGRQRRACGVGARVSRPTGLVRRASRYRRIYSRVYVVVEELPAPPNAVAAPPRLPSPEPHIGDAVARAQLDEVPAGE